MLSLHTYFCLPFVMKWEILNSHQQNNISRNLLPNMQFLLEASTPRLGQLWSRKKWEECLNKGLAKTKSFPVMLTKKAALLIRNTNKLKLVNQPWMNLEKKLRRTVKNKRFWLEGEGKVIRKKFPKLSIFSRKNSRKLCKNGSNVNKTIGTKIKE